MYNDFEDQKRDKRGFSLSSTITTNSTVTFSYLFICLLFCVLVRLIYLFMQSLVARVRSFNYYLFVNLTVCVIDLAGIYAAEQIQLFGCFYFELLEKIPNKQFELIRR